MKHTVRFTLIVLAVVFFAGCAKDLVTGKSSLNYYGVSSEAALGNDVLRAQLKAAKDNDKKIDNEADRVEYERLKKIVDRLSAVSHYQFSYEVHLVDVDTVNAWCAPGGKMMVYTGLWDPKKGLVKKGDDDELAAVMAHEMAHANARHVTEAISRNMTISVAGAAVQTAIYAGGSAQGADLFGTVFSDGINVFIPSYSRKNEFEADEIGILYMAKAGYDPRKAVALWKEAAKKQKDVTSIYESHPSSGARAVRLEAMLPAVLPIYEEAKKKDGKSNSVGAKPGKH